LLSLTLSLLFTTRITTRIGGNHYLVCCSGFLVCGNHFLVCCSGFLVCCSGFLVCLPDRWLKRGSGFLVCGLGSLRIGQCKYTVNVQPPMISPFHSTSAWL